MRVIVHSGVIAALLLSVAWAAPQGTDGHEGHDHGPHTADHHHHLHHGADEPHPKHEGEESYTLQEPNAEFAFALYKKLSAIPKLQSKNIFFSPFSISMALSMLALGAKGETFSQLYQALGYAEMTPKTVNEAYEHILHTLGHQKEHMQLDVSNAIAVKEGAKVIDKFLEDAKHYYDSEAFSVDFSKPKNAVKEINKYIAQETNNMITDIVNNVDSSTVMLLMNCIYFRGQWMKPFHEGFTRKDVFHLNKNTTVPVDMMTHTDYYQLFRDYDNFTTVLKLPYKGSASMVIVLPDEGKMKEVEDSISPSKLRRWTEAMIQRRVEVYFPKFSISSKHSLAAILQGMGVLSAFSDAADFFGMTDNAIMKVSEVEHKAVLRVDERGTVAEAATTEALVIKVRPKLVEVNRPFLVFITESSTNSILFMGKISNPAAE